MLLLAFDTATPTVTVALHDGTSVIAEAQTGGAMAQGELLAPLISQVLAQGDVRPADLTDVAVGVGPGPFTGLRVGVVTALMLGHTLGLKTHGVCSLDPLGGAIAEAKLTAGDFIVATDARRKEIYWARFSPAGRRLAAPAVDKPAFVADLGFPVIGRGAELHREILDVVDGPLDPSATKLAELVVAGSVEILPLEPLYLRRPDATPQILPSRP